MDGVGSRKITARYFERAHRPRRFVGLFVQMSSRVKRCEDAGTVSNAGGNEVSGWPGTALAAWTGVAVSKLFKPFPISSFLARGSIHYSTALR